MKAQNTYFYELAEVFLLLESTSSSLKMREILSDFFKKLSPQELKITAYLIQGQLGPSYKNIEFGLADKLVLKSFKKVFPEEDADLEKIYSKLGDMGLVAQNIREKVKSNPKNLSIMEVFERLKSIALLSGTGSQEKKLDDLANLILNVSPLEAKYIVRIVLGTLRLGVAEMTFLYALSKAFTGDYEFKQDIERAFNVMSDLGEVAYELSVNGVKGIKNISPKVGVPIRMMLAQRVYDIEEAKSHIKGNMIVEYKYDGERVQAHILKNGEVILFSRRHENITSQYPDIVRNIKKSFKGKEAILEGEAVAVDVKTGKLLDFQTLMRRRRKYDVSLFAKEIPIVYFIFDTLFLDGKSLLEVPLISRKKIIESKFSQTKGIKFSKYIIADSVDEVEKFFYDAVDAGTEGIMIKSSESEYRAGTRGWLWIKFKRDYTQELSDSFDLVVVGGIYGAGRRAGTYGSLLAASFDPETNKFYSFTKVGAGFTDDDLANLPKMLDKYIIKNKHRLVETDMDVDVWFEPQVVMEVSGAEITISPVHTVAKDKIKKGGLALRFPRFLRWRNDKKPFQATTVQEIYDLYKRNKKGV